MHLEFEPHSYYYSFAIKHDLDYNDACEFEYTTDSKICIVHDQKINLYDEHCEEYAPEWSAYIDDGMTYGIYEITAPTLKELKSKIRTYWLRDDYNHVPAYYAKKLLKSKEANNA